MVNEFKLTVVHCMRVDLPLDKKTGKSGLGRRAAGPRADGPSGRRAAGPSRAVGRGPLGRGPSFGKTPFKVPSLISGKTFFSSLLLFFFFFFSLSFLFTYCIFVLFLYIA